MAWLLLLFGHKGAARELHDCQTMPSCRTTETACWLDGKLKSMLDSLPVCCCFSLCDKM